MTKNGKRLPIIPGMIVEANIVTGQNDHGAKKRIELRLTRSEYKAVIKRFDKNDCSIQTWIINSIRASLLNKPQFAMSEVKALWESSSQLRLIGRNRNQITRKFHEWDSLDMNNENVQNLSAYINHTLKDKKQSVWIAQREGRAKDGFDKTNPGLLKMFGMAAKDNLLDHLISLNITPVSLAYELDPCDVFKVPELLKTTVGEAYVKAKGEDEMNMLFGMKGDKGNVHVQFGTPINDKIKGLSDIKNRNQLLKAIGAIIDKEIYQNYHLWNSNYVAYDLLHSTAKYVDKYDANGKEKFQDYMSEKLKDFEGNKAAQEIFLKMYANPTINAEATK